ncbi:MAG: class I SAM-dependent methyltransferase [Planctomycetes bacterium]|nr:class I SAM-dependent methyltransferase [Planctomycetota bacterium]
MDLRGPEDLSRKDSRDYFETVAPEWDRIRSAFYSERVREAAFARAGVRAGQLAADVGAGTGFVTEGLLARGVRVIALDPSRAMLGELARKFGRRDLLLPIQADGERLPLDSGSVDLAFANMMLHHAPDPAAAIAEMARVLVPGGALAVTDLDLHSHAFLLEEHHDRWPGFDRGEVARWFAAAGLVHVSIEPAPEPCCGESCSSGEKVTIGIWIACGKKGRQRSREGGRRRTPRSRG